MSVQDKLERILREMHIMVSRGAVWQENEDFVLIHKKQMQKELNSLSLVVNEMMEAYEATEQSRNRGELEAEKHRVEIVRNANRQAEDIYAASVLYTDDALGRIGDIIEEAEKSMKEVWNGFHREIEEEKRLVRSNQLELKTQLEDLKDTAKYIKIIEERNREIAKAKAKKQQDAAPRRYERKVEEESEFVPITPEIKIYEEYFEKAGLTPEGLPIESVEEEPKVYEKPEIKINEEYFKKAGIPIEKSQEDAETTAANATADESAQAAGSESAETTVAESAETDSEQAAGSESTETTETEIERQQEAPATSEFAGEITPELEEQWMQELDMEYFEWRDKDTKNSEKKEKRRGLFGRRDKS